VRKPKFNLRDSKRKRKKRRKKTKIESEIPKPNPFDEKVLAAPSSSKLLVCVVCFGRVKKVIIYLSMELGIPTQVLSLSNHCPTLSARQNY
jgi:hypothetical protein